MDEHHHHHHTAPDPGVEMSSPTEKSLALDGTIQGDIADNDVLGRDKVSPLARGDNDSTS